MYASWAMQFEHSSFGMIPEAPPQERMLMSTTGPHQRVCSALYAVARVSPGPCVDSLSGRVVPAVWLADQDHEIGRDDHGNRWTEARSTALHWQSYPPTSGKWYPWAMELAGHVVQHRYDEASSHDVGVAVATALCSMQPCRAVAPRSPNNIG